MTQVPNSDSAIFRAAAKLSPEQRGDFLKEACGNNQGLRDEVESLLRAHDPDGSFLQSPALAVTVNQRMIERPGMMIGSYKLREQIGEGGFGVVYVAEQEKPVRRKVALKLIKPGMDTEEVIARFEAERQALALMDHPNVARVFDAGTSDGGRPYFVMELVQGVNITEFCDRNCLPARQRMELFADVCRAVQHAHQKGIIHRDLKPSNIMVTLHDGKPVIKVIDFGVSKALSQRLTEKSIYTAYGQMIGTPAYMSPEQAEMSGLGIDTRSDIYSLGVLLYELLTGQTPLDANRLRASGYAEIMRIICEEEPPRPSMKVSTLGEKATVIAKQRQTNPDHLRRDLAGELDWIVMKCLEKDRGRRYETANGLVRDIERYMRDEPVEACPPSTWYRLSKFTRKHRALLSTTAAFVALLAVGTIVSSWLAVRSTVAERQAQVARAEALQALENEKAARGEAITAKENAEWAAKRLSTATQLANEGIEFYYLKNRTAALKKFEDATEVEDKLPTIYFYRRMLYTEIGLWDLAADDYAKSFFLTARNHWTTCSEHAELRYYLGDEPGYRDACQEFLRQYGRHSHSDVQMRLLIACCLSSKPVIESVDLSSRAETLFAASDKAWHQSAAALAFLRAGNNQRVIEICDKIFAPGNNSPGGVHRLNHATRAIALHASGRDDEARMSLSQLEVAINQWSQEMVDGPVGTMPISWQDWLEAQILYREAKARIDGSSPVEDSRLVTVRQRALEITRGDVHTFIEAGQQAIDRQNWDDAVANFSTAIDRIPLAVRAGPEYMPFYLEMVKQAEVFERLVELRPDDFALCMSRGFMFASQREWSKAADDCRRSLEFFSGRENDRSASRIFQSLATLYLLAGDDEAYHGLRKFIVDKADGIDGPTQANAFSRAYSLRPLETSDDSVPMRLAEQALSASPKLAWYLYGVGAAHYRAGRYEEAISRLNESLQRQPKWDGRGQNYVMLAMACHQLGRKTEANNWLAKAKTALIEMERTIGSGKYGFAASSYLTDWLAIQVLIPEAEQLLAGRASP